MPNVKLTKIIERKRNGFVLSSEDISYFVRSVLKSISNEKGAADRSQIGAMLMAIYLKGLNGFETVELTNHMVNSSEILIWPEDFKDLVVDKHSTGGVGDKVSLVLAPVLAALNLKVPMISGRSLSHTGGTLDKLESIPGYRVSLTKQEIQLALSTVGCCIVGQTTDCAPADKVLYHCREITATVDCPPLITASIASKKLNEGLNSLVYDVKYGRGSIFKTKQEAIETAKRLVEASKSVNVAALLTTMECPLGRSIGNCLEVMEAIECLKGEGPKDVSKIVSALGAELLYLAQNCDRSKGENLINDTLSNGTALKKFHDMLLCQGVSRSTSHQLCFGDPSKVLTEAPNLTKIRYSGEEGFIVGIDPLKLASLWKEEDHISQNNHGVGFTLLKTVGDKIYKGDIWLQFHHHHSVLSNHQEIELSNAITVASKEEKITLIDSRISYREGVLIVENL